MDRLFQLVRSGHSKSTSSAPTTTLFGSNQITQKTFDFLSYCIDFLLTHGINEQGIFRVPGEGELIKRFKEAANKEASLNDTDFTRLGFKRSHVPEVASLFKLFFREMPDSLLMHELYDCFISAHGMPAEHRSHVLKRVVKLLEPERARILEILLIFLRELAKHSEKTLMNAHNLAIVFAPNILRSGSDNPGQVITDAKAALEIVFLLLSDESIMSSREEDEDNTSQSTDEEKKAKEEAAKSVEFRLRMQENYQAIRKDSSRKLEQVSRKARLSQNEFNKKLELLSQKILDGEIDANIFDDMAGKVMDPSLIAQFAGMDSQFTSNRSKRNVAIHNISYQDKSNKLADIPEQTNQRDSNHDLDPNLIQNNIQTSHAPNSNRSHRAGMRISEEALLEAQSNANESDIVNKGNSSPKQSSVTPRSTQQASSNWSFGTHRPNPQRTWVPSQDPQNKLHIPIIGNHTPSSQNSTQNLTSSSVNDASSTTPISPHSPDPEEDLDEIMGDLLLPYHPKSSSSSSPNPPSNSNNNKNKNSIDSDDPETAEVEEETIVSLGLLELLLGKPSSDKFIVALTPSSTSSEASDTISSPNLAPKSSAQEAAETQRSDSISSNPSSSSSSISAPVKLDLLASPLIARPQSRTSSTSLAIAELEQFEDLLSQETQL